MGMSVLMLTIPMAVLLGGFFLWGFIWAVKSGQFDDMDSPAHRMLDLEDKIIKNKVDERL
jgi:cbb3-type cytochrome oxidase maturation protein